MRELLEVERLARLLLNERIYQECEELCGHEVECRNTVKGEVACPKCSTMVPFEKDCAGIEDCNWTCGAEVEVDIDDVARELRLALVALDLARSRESFGEEAVSGTVAVAKTEAA